MANLLRTLRLLVKIPVVMILSLKALFLYIILPEKIGNKALAFLDVLWGQENLGELEDLEDLEE